MNPIATYKETRLNHRRRFELYSDTVRVSGDMCGIKYENTIPLERLHPLYTRMWTYSAVFFVGTLVFVIGIVPLIIGLSIMFLAGTADWLGFVVAYGVVATAVGFALALANSRSIEHVCFLSDAGVAVLDVGRVGPKPGEFDEFVDMLIEQIQVSRGQT